MFMEAICDTKEQTNQPLPSDTVHFLKLSETRLKNNMYNTSTGPITRSEILRVHLPSILFLLGKILFF